MQLNDTATDAQRQRLLPFVMRLACADTPEIEHKLAAYIGARTAGRYTFEQGLSILEHVLVIGRKAEAVASEVAKSRMESLQMAATTATAVADSPLFSSIKSWFLTKHTEIAT